MLAISATIYKIIPQLLVMIVLFKVVYCQNECGTIPQQVSLALTDTVSNRRISFVGFPPCDVLNESLWWSDTISSTPPSVSYWSSKWERIRLTEFESITIDVDKEWNGMIFRFLLSGLRLGVSYTYEIYFLNHTVGPFSFTIREEVIRILSVADVGTNESAKVNVKLMEEHASSTPYDFVLHAGDLSYSAIYSSTDAGTVDDEFGRQMQNISAHAPYMVCPGNKEKDEWKQVPYHARWWMPYHNLKNKIFWYSFDYFGVHVISISTQNNISLGSKQREWLEEDLQSENCTKANWRIVLMHKPLYTSSLSHTAFGIEERLNALWEAYKVDLVIAGHDHQYERTYPVLGINGTISTERKGTEEDPFRDWSAPIYVVIGNGGAELSSQGFRQPQPEWSAYRRHQFGFTEIEIEGKNLKFTAHFIDGIGADTFHIRKSDEPNYHSPKILINTAYVLIVIVAVLLLSFAAIGLLYLKRRRSRKTSNEIEFENIGYKQLDSIEDVNASNL